MWNDCERGGSSCLQVSFSLRFLIGSHYHFDHCIPYQPYLPSSTTLFGPGTCKRGGPGWPADPNSVGLSLFLDPAHPNAKNVKELPDFGSVGWKSFGPFERAWDFWDDGSFWLIDAPGHAPGNLIAAARLQNSEWVVMGGDCAHSKYFPQRAVY
jgi:glyoxylase-like metal-dependent hydrolase (beta-lactamase superfamily II)